MIALKYQYLEGYIHIFYQRVRALRGFFGPLYSLKLKIAFQQFI